MGWGSKMAIQNAAEVGRPLLNETCYIPLYYRKFSIP